MKDVSRLAQSASAIGAAIVGFGLGAKFGSSVTRYFLLIIIAGGIWHVWGMYIMQIKEYHAGIVGVAKWVWISAWICLLALTSLVMYFTFVK